MAAGSSALGSITAGMALRLLLFWMTIAGIFLHHWIFDGLIKGQSQQREHSCWIKPTRQMKSGVTRSLALLATSAFRSAAYCCVLRAWVHCLRCACVLFPFWPVHQVRVRVCMSSFLVHVISVVDFVRTGRPPPGSIWLDKDSLPKVPLDIKMLVMDENAADYSATR